MGNFKNNGRTWCEEAEAVNDHDFPQAAFCKAVPYGIYDIKQNHGHVYIGQSADTPEFAVSAIANWWENVGKAVYPAAKKLLILGDAGGSNGCRPRRWKEQLQTQLADKLKIEVVVSHYPTGASKWNPIEHRMFGPISMNWSGKPLRSLKDMVNYIQGTVTKTGLEVKATLVDQVYEKGIQITKSVMDKLDIEFHNVCPRWNYTIKPRTAVC